MFKFMRTKGPHTTAERQKLQKELFSYRRTLQHGFPNKPTALAWDPSLRLLGIGTTNGAIKVFGKPGVEFYGQHQSATAVTRLVFLPNVGRIVSLCDDNSLHLWEVNKNSLVEVKTQALEGKLKKISALCVESSGNHLLLGTEGGNIYLLDLHTFTITPDIIYQDIVLQNIPEDYKLNPGAVESVSEQPDEPSNILIGYNRGLIVLWNRSSNAAIEKFVSNQQLESICWHEDGQSFTSSHNDGSYVVWEIGEGRPLNEPVSTYGPFPCKAIPKIIKREFEDSFITVFSGGLPRASYSDKYTVTVIHNTKHIVFDFTSKVVDFALIDSKASNLSHSGESLENGTSDSSTQCQPEALVVLADEEIVVIDLLSENWKMMNIPYLVSLHASSVTCSQHVSGVPEELWEQLKDAGRAQTNNLYSRREWPIDGGELLCSKGEQPRREILLTGHEDGTIRFWDAGRVNLMPLYKFSTAQLFTGDDIIDESMQPLEEEEDWPPFRKTGVFDPYSDDPRLAIKRVILCPLSGTLLVAGTAGHLIIAQFDTEVLTNKLQISTMNIVSDRDGFIWKGYDQLTPKTGEINQSRGFQGMSIIQLHPPAAITCCTLQADWGLVAAGTAHGLAVFDYKKQKAVLVKCTLNPNDLTGAGDTPISRRKSFKKSLRESFRRLRKGRSTRWTQNASPTAPPAGTPATRNTPTDENFSPLEAKPIERQIEARPVEDSMGSMVRCLYFARTFIISVQNTTPTLWAGTNNGTVYVFTITVPNIQKRDTDDVLCQLGKEIQLKHRAPVIGIAVLDGSSKPLPEPLEVEKGVAPLPDTTQPHRVVIASEEQFKIFTLPALKPFCKFKLTAHDGARVRRMAFGTFSCQLPDTETKHTEVDLLCLTNLGDCVVLSIPDLKRQLNAAAVRREDINGISSLVFTRNAEALYLHSSSELQRICLSATHVTGTRCYLSLPLGARNENGFEGDIEGQIHADEHRENETAAPLVNGTVDSTENSVIDKIDEVRENGDDTLHNVTVSSSVGDITIDSVKDHIGCGDDFANRISNITVTKTTITTVTNQDGEMTSSSVTTTSANQETTVEPVTEESAQRVETKRIQVSHILLRAPLALSEGLDCDGHINGEV